MKRTALRTRKRPITWDGFEFASLHGDSSDTLDDRINDSLPDSDEDERVSVEVILHRMIHGVS